MALQPLPIDEVLPRLKEVLRQERSVVLEAPPGAGKTTRVPGALLELMAPGLDVLVLEPRRLAARLAAARVAEERGERPGQTIGYQIRFESVSGPSTRIHFLTEGILTRRLVDDPRLEKVGAVVLDEFHERHLHADLALAMLKRLQASLPELKLVVMSATLDAAPIAKWLECQTVRSEGRPFPVEIEHLNAPDERPLDQQVAGALKRLLQAGLDGDVLAFLPGAAEIRRSKDACTEVCERNGIELHVLHGDLSAAEQDRAIKKGPKRKVILSTNVAETSVTIEGVAAVIDSGLARVAGHSPWSGLAALKVQKVSKSSAIQRAGRAGRLRAGKCLRLYTKQDFEARAMSDAPEIKRTDLAEAALALHAAGVSSLVNFPFFEAPSVASLEAADGLLSRLSAVDDKGALTPTGRRMLRFPTHPRLARLVIEAERRGVGSKGATLAALLGERDIRLEARARLQGPKSAERSASGPSDLLELLSRFAEAEAMGARSAGVDQGAFQSVERVRRQLERIAERKALAPASDEAVEEALLQAVLAGFPDRVARRRKPKSPEVLIAGGVAATLDQTSVVHEAELMVAADAEERRGGVVVRLASEVQPEWLLELFPERITDFAGVEWNAEARRVDKVTRLAYDGLALEETRQPSPPSHEAAQLLAQQAVAAGIGRFVDPEALVQLRERLELLRVHFPDAGVPSLDDAHLAATLTTACEGSKSFADLESADLLSALHASLDPQVARLLATQVPDRITLPGGRGTRVHYEPGKPPWVESRLQDFFGLAKGPSVCGGRVMLVLHLLAPNQRAVQVTTDLAGFWERHYPGIRKELMRKYPRHSWPEDGRTAVPPPPKKR